MRGKCHIPQSNKKSQLKSKSNYHEITIIEPPGVLLPPYSGGDQKLLKKILSV